MPIVYRFKNDDDFEESCYRLGIPWVPPQIIKLSRRKKQEWQRKVLCGKIKVHKYRERNKRFLDRYRECLKEATWINGVVDPDSLPPRCKSILFGKEEEERIPQEIRKSYQRKGLKDLPS